MPKKSISTLEQKVQWLLAHQSIVWEDKKVLVKAMKKDGLIASSTNFTDINLEVAIVQAKLRLKGE